MVDRGLDTRTLQGYLCAYECIVTRCIHTGAKNVTEGHNKQKLEANIENRFAASLPALHVLQVAVLLQTHLEFTGACWCPLIIK
jgi:hypothetical protein